MSILKFRSEFMLMIATNKSNTKSKRKRYGKKTVNISILLYHTATRFDVWWNSWTCHIIYIVQLPQWWREAMLKPIFSECDFTSNANKKQLGDFSHFRRVLNTYSNGIEGARNKKNTHTFIAPNEKWGF